MNKAFIIGNLTREPELRTTGSGISVCTFTVAVARRMSKNDETDFIPVVTWRGLADNCAKYLVKGQKVAVCGSIQTRSYEAQDGTKRYVTGVIADDVEFLAKPMGSSAPAAPARQQPAASNIPPKVNDDDLFGAEVEDFTPLDDEELPF